MRRIGPIFALILVALVNAVVLAGAFWNRRGEPDATLILTERELPIGYLEKENTGMWLRLSTSGGGGRWFAAREDSGEVPAWSRPERLQELGFDCSLPATDPEAELFYSKALPLERYAVLEYEGEAWRQWLAAKQRAIEELAREAKPEAVEYERRRLEVDRVLATRLFLIDVGRDPDELRRRYPDRSRYVVAGTIVGLALRGSYNPDTGRREDPFLDAFARELLVDEIHVPHRLRTVLETFLRQDLALRSNRKHGDFGAPPDSPRYEVTLKYGRRHEPWIADIRPLEAPAANQAPGREGGR